MTGLTYPGRDQLLERLDVVGLEGFISRARPVHAYRG